jgi:hypothetical protein
MEVIIKEIRNYLTELIPQWSILTDKELLEELLQSHKRMRENTVEFFDKRKGYNKI